MKTTQTKRFVKPAAGRKPRHPELGRNIATEGEWIVDSPRLRKFLRDGDVLDAKEPRPTKAAAPGKKGARS